MKPRDHCCCAIPVVNAGIYATLTEQFVLGILVGTLSVATPMIVGAATPSFAKWILGIICYVGAGIQILGFIGVAKERPILFRRYTTLHVMVTLAAFSVAAVWIGLSPADTPLLKESARRNSSPATVRQMVVYSHLKARRCAISSHGLTLDSWLYFYIVVSGYGSGSREDHEKYDSVYSTSPLNDDIPMTNRNDPWDSREDPDVFANTGRYGHGKKNSNASDAGMLNDPYQQPYPGGSLSYPVGARTQEPMPTPHFDAQDDPYYSSANGLGRPDNVQNHPGQL
ncbi:hypothetical protein EWM64_g416 [Hericium alpestre]|uniref:Uncharacterized protein n=1 Tax=Hericium alpestre TaxID=135208 RepID=A0A4Z0AB57_9AGAM|nr:hypothetical protein EWM64_g416 [Hericium alpestre]